MFFLCATVGKRRANETDRSGVETAGFFSFDASWKERRKKVASCSSGCLLAAKVDKALICDGRVECRPMAGVTLLRQLIGQIQGLCEVYEFPPPHQFLEQQGSDRQVFFN